MNTATFPSVAATRCSLFAIAGSLLLGACGGGDSPAERAVAASSGDARRVPLAAAKTPDAAAFLDWAERAYPQYFPSHQANASASPYVYRYYPETGNYIGVAGSAVSVLGPVSGNAVLGVGSLSDFACQVTPADCGLPRITTQPKAVYAMAGESVSMSIRADDSTMLQWQLSTDGGFNFTDLKGVVGGTYTLGGLRASDNGRRYRVVLSNAKGSVISDIALLSVLSSVPTTGSPAECVMPAQFPPGRKIQIVAGSALSSQGTNTVTATSKPDVVFEGRPATAYEMRVVSSTPGVASSTVTIYSSYQPENGVVSIHGSLQRNDYSSSLFSETRTVYTPAQTEAVAGLQPGESQPEQTLSATSTSITTTNGVAGTPSSRSYSGSFGKTFVGMEAVTSRAGTFRTCKFISTSVVNGKTTNSTSWLLAGSGLNVDHWQDKSLPLLSITVDGVRLVRN